MRILIAAGGTAGHINPALAIAETFKKNQKDSEILFVGSKRGMEEGLVKKAGYKFLSIRVRGFQRKITFKNIARNIDAVFLLLLSKKRARNIINNFKPDIVIGTGGYVSGPIVMQAAKMNIKTAIHEQNAYPGLTNRTLSKYVDIVFLAVLEAKKHLKNKNCIVVGNPIRNSLLYKTKEEARKELNMDDNFCILSFGGSLGAVKINEIAADIISWHNKDKKINHIHAMGRLGKDIFDEMLKMRGVNKEENSRLDIREYIDNMDVCLKAADIVICRAGALTIAELEATSKPSILVPSPNVSENHQYHNALVLENNKAGIVIEEKDYNKDKVIKIVESFYKDPEKLKEYGKNASKLAIMDTSDRIYNEIVLLTK